MTSYTEQRDLPYGSRQLFDLVIDIERYPEFLPWCRAARITERKEDEFLGELVIAFNHMTERYTSRVTWQRPADDNAPGAIDVVMVKGPFEHLVNRWRFEPTGEAATRIDFFLDFKFRSRILEKMIGPLFGKATVKMIEAFTQRAEALYGNRVA